VTVLLPEPPFRLPITVIIAPPGSALALLLLILLRSDQFESCRYLEQARILLAYLDVSQFPYVTAGKLLAYVEIELRIVPTVGFLH